MFHIELRQFPHNMCHFNMTEQELFAQIVDGWAQEQWIEMGDRKWNPHQSKLIVLEGPRIPVEQLSMGRGWPTAQRQSEDVTERVIAQAKRSAQNVASAQTASAQTPEAGPAGTATPAVGAQSATDDPSQSSQQLLSLLGEDPAALLQAWRLATGRRPEMAPSEALALAEQTLRSLDGSSR
jgi:hypothetical protein